MQWLLWLCVLYGATASPQRTVPLGESSSVIRSLEENAQTFLQELDRRGSLECTKVVEASWKYASNITEEHKQLKAAAQLKNAEWQREAWDRVQTWDGKWQTLKDPYLKRQFKFMSVLGTAALPEADLEKYNSLQTEMEETYSTAKICDFKNKTKCDLVLEPDITKILRTSQDYLELEHVWNKWRDNTGKTMRNQYKEFVDLGNKAAKLNNFDNMGEMWLHSYETKTFRSDLARIWDQLKPLYQELHAYVRRKLRETYGETFVSKRGAIPANILGNMWAQSWDQINELVIPYPEKTSVDVTAEMIKQKYTPKRMFELSEEFFTSVNLTGMPPEFWEHSIIEKPEGREVVCHASAWDFCNGKDFRIKQCTVVTMNDLITVHHEMGHIEYFLQYKHLPGIFRGGANPGFHEAVGDVLALSVATPKHLQKIGLLDVVQDDPESDINFLLKMAIDKIAFLPFGYLMDLWRWDVFSGKTQEKDWNCAWWKLRYDLQGIRPPTTRSENDFDPGAKYHIPADVPYIRYFVSFIIQFQFHKTLCLKAGQYDPLDPTKPLHKCDIYQSAEAGNALGDMLQLGSSKPWPEALAALTGTTEMDAAAIREYFKPLEEWLRKDNEQHGEIPGWVSEEEICTPSVDSPLRTTPLSEGGARTVEEQAESFLKELDERGSKECTVVVNASWNYATDITEQHKQIKSAAQLKYAEWEKEAWNKVQGWKGKWETLKDPSLRRQFKFMSILGRAALSKADLEKFNNLETDMETIYSTAKICDFKNTTKCDLSLEPDIKRILKSSRDYKELEHVWKSWRDNSGKRIRPQYKEFVAVANKAAELNNFANMGDMWLHPYESDTFRTDVSRLWDQLRPLYQQVHAYVRRKLRENYGEKYVSKRGPIPAHLFGNMWSQDWSEIGDLVIPYPNKASIDITPAMVAQGYTQRQMFELSEKFFVSLNLTKMPAEFWEHSVIKKAEGKEMVCHASAWDFCNGVDFRIKQCTDITMSDLITVHHEMGHIEYYLQYKHLPNVFRSGANPGFHEAVGDVLALSVATPKHLHQIGLLDVVEDDPEADINFLLQMAIEKIAFLPFGYLMDVWRWDVFSGKTPEKDWNCAWWKLRYDLQGIKPPVTRSENDFDPGAKWHIPGNTPYIRYFVSFVIQFQFHKTLCLKAGQYDPLDPTKPLHKCDIYQSAEAGNALGDMLQLGSSKPWPEAMAALTGGREMDASVIREYFKPLEEWLRKDNDLHGEIPGWETTEELCTSAEEPGIGASETATVLGPV